MPMMPRVKGKATKIAYKILGVPNNIKFRKRPYSDQIARRLLFEDTSRVR